MATLVRKIVKVFKRYRFTALIFFLLCVLSVKSEVSASVATDEAAAYASFIQNLVNHASISKKGAFCILGNDSVARALSKSAANVQKSIAGDSYRNCKAIYVSVENITNLKFHLNKMASDKVLTISTFEEFVENGGMIQVGMGRRDFELTVDVKSLHSAQIKLDTLSTNLIVN